MNADNEKRFLGLPVNCPVIQGNIESAIEYAKQAGPSREFSMVITKLQEALLWLKAAEQSDDVMSTTQKKDADGRR